MVKPINITVFPCEANVRGTSSTKVNHLGSEWPRHEKEFKAPKGPQFLQYSEPLITVLRELGGSGSSSEVTDLVIERLQIPDSELEVTNKNGGSRVKNQIAWARFYMMKAGLLVSSKWGVWQLTKKGREIDLTNERVTELFKQVQKEQFKTKKQKTSKSSVASEDESPTENEAPIGSYHDELLGLLKNLPPEGFERLCQRLLRESGFQKVVVTGRSGDGGIDGHGVLELNPFVTFKVLFQCKRYAKVVPVEKVRDFRGSMQGRADKGIIISTGTFSSGSKAEATRDGVPPIELVDGEKLIQMFEQLELGLKPKKSFEVDPDFFEAYR